VAKPGSRGRDTKKKKRTPVAGWAKLTWDDLDLWAGSRSVSRGRAYQRDGRVKDLRLSGEGKLLATVVGGERYVTTVSLSPGSKRPLPESACTCPVGVSGCKHAVAVVAEYLQAVADGRDVPNAAEDDPRWEVLEGGRAEVDDEWGEDASWDDEDDDDSEDSPAYTPRGASRPAQRRASKVNWDDKIQQHLRAKSQGELADLVWSLTKRFPEVYQEFRERLALQSGDVARLVAEARREIRQATSEPGWQNHWDSEGYTPDYSRVRHRFERLLELGHADEVVSLGREFIERGLSQVGESNDEGETSSAFAECLPVIFQAVARSSLSGPERLLFAIDAQQGDDYDLVSEASEDILDAPSSPEDWSAVADTLTGRLETPRGWDEKEDSFSRDYRRDGATGWIATALEKAGREDELRALYESEARVTGSYERLVKFLAQGRHFEDAERWAREGIVATKTKYPGIADHLATQLCELARGRQQWDVVAAHAARAFFDHPAPGTFDELMKAAKKAKVEGPVRDAALRFLETGAAPFRTVSPRAAAAAPPRARSSAKKRAASNRTAVPSVPPKEAAEGRLKIDPTWPLPIPDYLIPLMGQRNPYDPGPHPHYDVLLTMAIAAKRPDEVLHWFGKMRSEPRRQGYYDPSLGYADRVADAVSTSHPVHALEIYMAALNAQLPHAHSSAYEAAAGYLKKLRPIYEALDRAAEWTALVASIREKYRNRPRFMEVLDRLDGRTIVETARPRRK